MKKYALKLLIIMQCLFLCACSSNETNNNTENNGSNEITEEATNELNEDSNVVEEISEKNNFIEGEWELDAAEKSIYEEMKSAFINNWRESWMMGVGCVIGDEKIYDILMFPQSKSDGYSCVAYGNVHLEENYRSDGSKYYLLSEDANTPLVDAYLTFDMVYIKDEKTLSFSGFGITPHFTLEEAISETQKKCGEKLVNVLTDEMRQSFVDEVSNNVDIYEEMKSLLVNKQVKDARNLYYKTTNLTYEQSKQCLVLLAEFSELYSSIDYKTIPAIELGGKLILDDWEVMAWQDEESSNENDYIISIEYKYSIKGGSLAVSDKWEIENIPITLDVDNKTYSYR